MNSNKDISDMSNEEFIQHVRLKTLMHAESYILDLTDELTDRLIQSENRVRELEEGLKRILTANGVELIVDEKA